MGTYRTISCGACGGLLVDRHHVGRKESIPCFMLCPHCGRAIDFRSSAVEWFLLSEGQRQIRIASTFVSGFLCGFFVAVICSLLVGIAIGAEVTGNWAVGTLIFSLIPTVFLDLQSFGLTFGNH